MVTDSLTQRSKGQCELCSSPQPDQFYTVGPEVSGELRDVHICKTCRNQIEGKEAPDSQHWQCLGQSMWSEIPAVQVLSWRMLQRFKEESWAADHLDVLYLDESLQAWAEAGAAQIQPEAQHLDSFGNVLENGDSVVLTKSLDVKGSSLRAAVGTVVKNIRLVKDDPDAIEGKIEGQTIVILTRYLKKQK